MACGKSMTRRVRQYGAVLVLATSVAASIYWTAVPFSETTRLSSPVQVVPSNGHLEQLTDRSSLEKSHPVPRNFRSLEKRQSDTNDDPYDSNPPSEPDPEDDGDDEKEWEACINRGCKLNELMKKPESSLEEQYKTKWNSFDDIAKYGWTLSEQEGEANVNEDEKTSALPALQALGIPGLDDSSWRKVPWVHQKETTIDGKTYPATNGKFINFYNPSHGIIVAVNNHSPGLMDSNVPEDQTVPLQRWSDITHLTWLDVCQVRTQDPGKLKYIMRVNVISPDAEPILSKIAGVDDLGDLDDTYPGVTVPEMPDSNEGRAIVGFSNGRGVAWLLAQHKETFGDTRYIQDVKFWDSYNGNRPSDLLPGLDNVPNMLYTLS